MSNPDVDTIIRTLYRTAVNEPVDDFPQWCFDHIRRYIDFGSGSWAYTSFGETLNVHAIHLYKLPYEGIPVYEANKDEDRMFKLIISSVGKTINSHDHLTTKDYTRSRIYNEFIKPFHVENALSTMVRTMPANLGAAITFFNDNRKPFEDSDRLFIQRLVPHLVEAAQINRMTHLRTAPCPSVEEYVSAVCDGKGMLHSDVGLGFASVITRQWPHWRGPELPQSLCVSLIQAGGGNYESDFIIAKSEPYQQGGFFKVSVRARRLDDALTPREHEVATLLRQGISYKEVARVLSISPSTVTNHVNHIHQKLAIHSKSQRAALIKNR